MQRATRFAFLAVLVGVAVACANTPALPLAPTAVAAGAGAANLESDENTFYGALLSRQLALADTSSGFLCALGPFGVTDQSHFITTPSGNETLVCTGPTPFTTADRAEALTGFPCVMPSGTLTTDSRLVLTPSGQVVLTCQAR